MKKWLALILAACMLLAFAACKTNSAPEAEASAPQDEAATEPTDALTPEPTLAPLDAIAAAYEKTKQVKSVHQDLTEVISIKMSVPVISFEQNLDMRMEFHQDAQFDPFLTRLEGVVEYAGEKTDLLSYSEKIDDVLTVYSSYDNGATWQTASDDPELPTGTQTLAESLSWLTYIREVEVSGAETVNGSEATVYVGTLSSDSMKENASLIDSLDADVDGLDWSEVPDLPFTVCIDNATGYVVRLNMDIADTMLAILKHTMQSEDSGIPMDGFELSIEQGFVETVLSQFDAIDAIVIPEEAKAAPQNQPETDADSLFGTWVLTSAEGEEAKATVDMMLSFGMVMEFTFNEDGTGESLVSYGEESQTTPFTYTYEDGKIFSEGSSLDYRIENGQLYLTVDDMPLIFTRK